MEHFYSVENVPAHSVLLMSSAEQARDYPRGQIRLGFCPRCGFISNVAFESQLSDYSPHYEETQHYSPRFQRFARELAGQLIENYNLRHKTVLDIGCGKGHSF